MELLKNYSIVTIIEFIILMALTLKGGISFIEWFWPRLIKIVKRSEDPKRIRYDLKSHEQEIKNIKSAIDQLLNKIDTLIQSDRDDIKAYITRQHHYFVYDRGWIDDYSLDCIQKRYNHYVDQGGNSFIKGLMMEIRALPKKPMDQN